MTSLTEADQDDIHPTALSTVPLRVLTGIGLAQLGLFTALLTPVFLTLPEKMSAITPNGKAQALSLVLGVGAIFALLAAPLFGHLSDRTTSRFGMRRPWLVGGLVGTGVGFGLMAASTTVTAVLAGWCLVQVGGNAAFAALTALVSDQVPATKRARVSAIVNIAQTIAGALGIYTVSFLAHGSRLTFAIPYLAAVAGIGFLVLVLPDRRLDRTDAQPVSLKSIAGSFVFNPRANRDYAWVWAARFMMFMGFAFLLSYTYFYLTDHLRISDAQGAATRLFTIASFAQAGATIVTSWIGGWLSDRSGRRKLYVCVSTLGMALGLLLMAFTHAPAVFFVAYVINGLAQGVYFAVDLALVIDVLPDSATDAAKDLGVFNIANTLPQSLAPAVAPAILAIGTGDNYAALFIAATSFTVIAALAVLPVRKAR
ncbi:MFS transporter [Streptomyces diastatochromogenes]|uniref:MFS transporter n=1 Tax=Streptomyces diastatochromogenes TaxID=42236 RepID=UPI0036ABC862